MRRIIGFALFFIALGIAIVLLVPYEWICIFIMLLCLGFGYYLFCGK